MPSPPQTSFPLKRWQAAVAVSAALVLWLALWVFSEMVDDTPKGEFAAWDEPTIHLVRGSPRAPQGAAVVVTLARGVTFLGGTLMLSLLSVGVLTWLGLKRWWRAALVFGLTIVTAQAFTTLLKLYFARARPSAVNPLVAESSGSFPSGHALMSSVVYLMLSVLIARFPARARFHVGIVAGAFSLTFLIGLSRIYLGVHYPTDVVAGWSAGTALAIIGSAVLIWWERDPAKTR